MRQRAASHRSRSARACCGPRPRRWRRSHCSRTHDQNPHFFLHLTPLPDMPLLLRVPSRLATLLAIVCTAGAVQAQGTAVAPTPAQVRPAVDQAYTRLLAAPAVKQLLEAVKADHERSIEDLR